MHDLNIPVIDVRRKVSETNGRGSGHGCSKHGLESSHHRPKEKESGTAKEEKSETAGHDHEKGKTWGPHIIDSKTRITEEISSERRGHDYRQSHHS